MSNAIAPLHMVQMQMSSRDLARSAKTQNIPTSANDVGYALHGQLAALFGNLAPKPFRAIERKGFVTVLGYGSADQRALRDQMDIVAEPFDQRSLRDLATKTMPEAWPKDRRLGFEVRVCPTIRQGSKELDVYLSTVQRLEKGETADAREHVYGQWLARKLAGAAELTSCRMDRFRLIQLFRRHQDRSTKGRKTSRPMFPEAVLQGDLTIQDGAAFAKLLARGIGRHRAFGFGMLLLRPPSRS